MRHSASAVLSSGPSGWLLWRLRPAKVPGSCIRRRGRGRSAGHQVVDPAAAQPRRSNPMTENMITVALIVGDPGHDGLQLSEGSLAAAARMIEVHGAATHGRWDAGRRSTVWCFDIERARAADLKDELQTIWAGKLESVIWRPVGPAEVIRFA